MEESNSKQTKIKNSQSKKQNETVNNINENLKLNGKISRNLQQQQQQNEILPSGTLNITTNSNTTGTTNNDNKNSESLSSNKRKKPKSRSSSGKEKQLSNSELHKNHLDAWLETCLKDSSNTPQLSSSSEFLDYNQSSFTGNSGTSGNGSRSNRHHRDTRSFTHQPLQQFFPKPTTGFNLPFNTGFQKAGSTDSRNFVSNPHYFNNILKNSLAMINNDTSCDFASLPPLINLSTTGENIPIDSNFDTTDPNRRFSDPCLINPSDNEGSKMSGQNTPSLNPDQENMSNQNLNNKNNVNNMNNQQLFLTLMEQINLLHETNSKICRNLHDTKIDIEALKTTPNWGGMRHRRDSLSGLSTHSQPLHMGGFAFGTHSPAPTYHSGMYTPGMMTDVVREVKEAARVREDALLSRVKSMVEERSWSVGESNLRMMRDIEELKAQIQHLKSDKKESNKRITHLEAENKYIKQVLGSILNSRNEIIQNNSNYELPKSTPLVRRSTSSIINDNNSRSKRNSFNIHYNVLNNHDDTLGSSTIQSPIDCNNRSSSTMKENSNRNNSNNSLHQQQQQQQQQQFNGQLRITENFFPNSAQIDGDGLMMNVTDESDQHVLEMEKDTLELRRELQEAIASKKDAENRIIALEKVVKKFHLSDDKHNNGIMNDKFNYFNGIGNHQQQQPNADSNNTVNGGGRIGTGISSSALYNLSNGGVHTSTSVGERLSEHTLNSSHQNHHQITHITSPQVTGQPSKLSLAGPITDL